MPSEVELATTESDDSAVSRPGDLSWRQLPPAARLYVVLVMAAGAVAFVSVLPATFPRPVLFSLLLAAACVTSIWKVNLPIPLGSGSTLSVSYAADLMALLLLGPAHAVVVAVAGAWTQCTFRTKQRYPVYRTLFSMTAEALTMAGTGLVYQRLDGPLTPLELAPLAKPLVGAIATYFVLNTGLIAGAIAASTGRSWWQVWRDDFLWISASYMVAGAAGAGAAVVIARGEHWKVLLLVAPVYLTFRTYQVFVGRLEDQRRHTAETRRLHRETVDALMLARAAERALAEEKERLASTVAELTRLEGLSKKLLEREQAARASAEEGNRLKDQFLAMVSHELRTPLNAIVGWSDMLRSGRLNAADQGRAAEAIYSNSRRQARMIDELLDLARIRSGKLRLEPAPVDLEQVVHGAADVVQAAAHAKGIRIAIETDPSMGAIYGDPVRLQQVAWNLLSNAVKFTPPAGRVVVHLRRVNNVAELVVEDSGAGIPPEFLPWVFEPFLQADASTTRPFGGLGLGLSIVKRLVEAHGGSIVVDSEGEGRGATFTVRLPIVALGDDSADRYTPDADGAAAETGDGHALLEGLRVLVVDDDPESRDMVSTSLAIRGARVRAAASSAAAFEILERERIDVLLADIAMPGEDGYAFLRRLRASSTGSASVPAAALTALARDEDRQHALEAGFQLHLPKPLDSASLLAAVATLGRLGGAAGAAE